MLTFKEFQSNLTESVEEINEVNHREFASKGLMHPEMAKHMKVGQSMDFYAHGTGDKISGTVTKNDGKSVHVKADKDGRTATGSTHKFKVSSSLDEASTGNAFDWKNYTADRKGQGVNGSTKTYHDVKKTSTGTVYTKQVDKDGTSKGSGEDAAKEVEKAEQPKRGRGRPKGVGAKSGQYKPRDPAKKAASAAKAAATKAANRKARNEEFNQEFIEELMAMLVEDQDVEDFMDLLQEEEFDEFYVSEIEAIEEACKGKKKKTPVTESTVSVYANYIK